MIRPLIQRSTRGLSLLKINNLKFSTCIPKMSEVPLTSENDLYVPRNIPRPNETPEQLRARLVYQCRKRGILETDLIMSTFATKYLAQLSVENCKQLDNFLDYPDWDIYYWVTDAKEAPAEVNELEVFQLIREHAKNKDKNILRMPDL
jgi:succinate dehydrogenase assembly factor 2